MSMDDINHRDNLNLRPLGDADQADLLRWRNQPRVRRMMVNTRPIAEQEHDAWWQRTRDDRSRRWYVLERAGLPLAVLDYFDLNWETGEG